MLLGGYINPISASSVVMLFPALLSVYDSLPLTSFIRLHTIAFRAHPGNLLVTRLLT